MSISHLIQVVLPFGLHVLGTGNLLLIIKYIYIYSALLLIVKCKEQQLLNEVNERESLWAAFRIPPVRKLRGLGMVGWWWGLYKIGIFVTVCLCVQLSVHITNLKQVA